MEQKKQNKEFLPELHEHQKRINKYHQTMKKLKRKYPNRFK